MTRRGMTLVEMMVAVTATLVLMAAIAQIFAVFGTAVSDSRSVIELDSRMRAVAWRLRNDLGGATAPTLPPLSPIQDVGYFEIIEGPSSDTALYYDAQQANGAFNPAFLKSGTTAGPQATSDDRILGDTDDVLLFTTRNTKTPFLGRYLSGTSPITRGKYESPIAEVAWFLRPARIGSAAATANPVTYTLHRRQLLVVGYVGASPFSGSRNLVDSTMVGGRWATWDSFYEDFDLSVRAARNTGSGLITYLPNTLSDLTRRESRFMHNVNGDTTGSDHPYRFPAGSFQDQPAPAGLTFAGTSREGDDVVLTNVIGFDVRVFDPTAEVRADGSTLLTPGDPGFTSGTSVGQGCYVDLGNNMPAGGTARFSGPGDSRSGVRPAGGGTTWLSRARTWDTWSTHYETDGIDQDNQYGIDQGSNGLDDNQDGLVDNGDFDANGDGVIAVAERGEMEAPPPYPWPLRGIEVRLRCYEPSSRQVRQVTIRHSFVP
jgi:prepilin-type N-terminal cleavage/methylation domain-containing protein